MHKVIIFLLFPLLIGSESLNNQFLIALKKIFLSFAFGYDIGYLSLDYGTLSSVLKSAPAAFNFCFELITLINGLR